MSAFTGALGSAAADSAESGGIRLPPGFLISVLSNQTPEARSLALGQNATVFVGSLDEGKVDAPRGNNHGGTSDKTWLPASNLDIPTRVAHRTGDLYIAQLVSMVKLKDIDNRLDKPPAPEVVYGGFPSDTHHCWKYLRAGPDGKLYTAVDGACNVCLNDREIYASVVRLDPIDCSFPTTSVA